MFKCLCRYIKYSRRENCELSTESSRTLDIRNPSHFEQDGEYDYFERQDYGYSPPGGGGGGSFGGADWYPGGGDWNPGGGKLLDGKARKKRKIMSKIT